jgi:RNA polymerase sigma-70 factor (ECF subfamily)
MNTFIETTDIALIKRFQEGNNDALEMLIRRHEEKIFSSIFFLVKDEYLTEDLFQDVFIKIIDKLRKKHYNEEGKFLPWALRISHNLCVDYFRKIKRKPSITTSDNRDIFETINVVADSAEVEMMRKQSYMLVTNMLQTLPEDQREVIVLRFFAGLNFKDIAKVTNCSINTALGRMRYGLINLRKLMVEKEITL